MKKSYKNSRFKISAPTWNEKCELCDGSYSVSDVQDYFEYVIKKHVKVADNPPIRIYVNKIEKRITFRIKTGHYLQLLTPESMKLLGSIKSKIAKNKNVESILRLEITDVVLVHCNIVKNDYQQNSRVL